MAAPTLPVAVGVNHLDGGCAGDPTPGLGMCTPGLAALACPAFQGSLRFHCKALARACTAAAWPKPSPYLAALQRDRAQQSSCSSLGGPPFQPMPMLQRRPAKRACPHPEAHCPCKAAQHGRAMVPATHGEPRPDMGAPARPTMHALQHGQPTSQAPSPPSIRDLPAGPGCSLDVCSPSNPMQQSPCQSASSQIHAWPAKAACRAWHSGGPFMLQRAPFRVPIVPPGSWQPPAYHKSYRDLCPVWQGLQAWGAQIQGELGSQTWHGPHLAVFVPQPPPPAGPPLP